MEFWGVEVPAGNPLKVKPEDDTLIHISQASLGDAKGKKGESVPLFVKVGNQKLVLGTLAPESIPQLSCDLVFEKEFELSHNWGKGSVYFVGYKSPNMEEQEGEYFSDSEEEDEEVEAELPAAITANGKPAAAKPKAKPAEVKKNVKPESDDDDEDDESDSEGMDEDDDESEEVEEETPKKPEPSKKRANEAAPKTPVSSKKAKQAATPQKSEEKKKGGHTATPHPAKKGGKSPTAATPTPKSASQVSCGPCKKTFNSGSALDSHNKAKHASAAAK